MTREEGIQFLKGHFRYDTGNSWNASTSYAQKVKINTFVPSNLLDKAYSIIEEGTVYRSIEEIMKTWAEEYQHRYQAGFNGRSGGYIVLYTGYQEPTKYKSYCPVCGIRTYYPPGKRCHRGKCTGILRKPYWEYDIQTYGFRNIDQGEDFIEWDDEDIDERVKLVESFDAMVERCKECFLEFCKNFKVVEETIMVPKTIKVLEEEYETI